MRLMVARCSADYSGRLNVHLPFATRLVMVKADGGVAIFSEAKIAPLMWMSPPCSLGTGPEPDGSPGQRWTVTNKTGERLLIHVTEVLHDSSHDLGVDPGLVKDGVEAHLQQLLAEQVERLGVGLRLVRREFPTAIGPVDLLCRDVSGGTVAVEVKRRGDIDGVEQLSRYLDLLNRDPLLAPVRGVLAAQEIKRQARVLAADRGIDCVNLDYDQMRGAVDAAARLF